MATVFTPLGKENAKHKGVLIWDFEDWQRFNLSGKGLSSKKSTSTLYAKLFYQKDKNQIQKYLHNFIMWSPDGFEIDHINGDGLDNRKSNLRIVTRSANQINKKPITGKYRGVSFCGSAKYKYWKAYITKNKKRINLGAFPCEEDAWEARKKAELKYYPELSGGGIR